METIPCRGCRTELDPAAAMCPICLRPRGALEITRGFTQLREDQRKRRRRPFELLGALVLAGAAAGLAYRVRGPLAAAAASVRARVVRAEEEAMEPKNPLPPGAAPAPAPAAPAAPAPVSPRAAIAAAAPPPAPTPPAALPPPPARTPAIPEVVPDLPLPATASREQWVFYGRAYDLITLRPVAGARLLVEEGRSGGYGQQVETDAHGRFAAVLARLPEGSYEVRVSHPRYAAAVLYEPDIPYARLPLDQRREIARGARDGDVPAPPLSDVSGEESLRRDVFLAPREDAASGR
jgi:hypothetical protein